MQYVNLICVGKKQSHVVGALTLNRVAQLSTHHSSISIFPGFKAYSAPHIVHADLHSAFIGNVTSYKSQLTSYTGSYIHKHIMWLDGHNFYVLKMLVHMYPCLHLSYIVLLVILKVYIHGCHRDSETLSTDSKYTHNTIRHMHALQYTVHKANTVN